MAKDERELEMGRSSLVRISRRAAQHSGVLNTLSIAQCCCMSQQEQGMLRGGANQSVALNVRQAAVCPEDS